MRILITGSNGLLGQTLVRYLSKTKHEFLTTARKASVVEKAAWPHAILDVTDQEEVFKVVDEFKPDSIIHAAAMTHVDQCELNPDQCHSINVKGSINIGLAAQETGAHLVNISTDFIFDGEKGMYSEEDKPNPLSVYGQSKWEAEKALNAMEGLSLAHLRTILVYGVTKYASRNNIVLWAKENLEQKKPLSIIDDQFRAPTFVDDLAQASIFSSKNKVSGTYHTSGPDFLSIYELVLKIAEYWNLDKSLISKSSTQVLNQPAKRPPKTGFILDKAKENLNFHPKPLEEGLKKVEEYLQAWQ